MRTWPVWVPHKHEYDEQLVRAIPWNLTSRLHVCHLQSSVMPATLTGDARAVLPSDNLAGAARKQRGAAVSTRHSLEAHARECLVLSAHAAIVCSGFIQETPQQMKLSAFVFSISKCL